MCCCDCLSDKPVGCCGHFCCFPCLTVVATVKSALTLPLVLLFTLIPCVLLSVLMWPFNLCVAYWGIIRSKNIGCTLKFFCLLLGLIPAALYLAVVPLACVFVSVGLCFAIPGGTTYPVAFSEHENAGFFWVSGIVGKAGGKLDSVFYTTRQLVWDFYVFNACLGASIDEKMVEDWGRDKPVDVNICLVFGAVILGALVLALSPLCLVVVAVIRLPLSLCYATGNMWSTYCKALTSGVKEEGGCCLVLCTFPIFILVQIIMIVLVALLIPLHPLACSVVVSGGFIVDIVSTNSISYALQRSLAHLKVSECVAVFGHRGRSGEQCGGFLLLSCFPDTDSILHPASKTSSELRARRDGSSSSPVEATAGSGGNTTTRRDDHDEEKAALASNAATVSSEKQDRDAAETERRAAEIERRQQAAASKAKMDEEEGAMASAGASEGGAGAGADDTAPLQRSTSFQKSRGALENGKEQILNIAKGFSGWWGGKAGAAEGKPAEAEAEPDDCETGSKLGGGEGQGTGGEESGRKEEEEECKEEENSKSFDQN